MHFGFEFVDGTYKEYIPSIFKAFGKYELHRMFISQYNAHVKKEFYIKPLHVKGCESIFEIFVRKIDELLKDDSFKKCHLSKKLIDSYRRKDFQTIQANYGTMPTHIGAQFIFMIFAKEIKGLLFNAKDFFSNYVYDKIQKKHKEKNVLFYEDFIVMEFSKSERVGIYPSFKYMETQKPYLADEDIKNAFKILQKYSLTKLFIAYPKNSDFTKHIVVEHGMCSTRLTLVPYAISNKIVYNSRQNLKKTKEIRCH